MKKKDNLEENNTTLDEPLNVKHIVHIKKIPNIIYVEPAITNAIVENDTHFPDVAENGVWCSTQYDSLSIPFIKKSEYDILENTHKKTLKKLKEYQDKENTQKEGNPIKCEPKINPLESKSDNNVELDGKINYDALIGQYNNLVTKYNRLKDENMIMRSLIVTLFNNQQLGI